MSCPIGFPSCDVEAGLSPSAGDEIAMRLQETFVSMDQRLEQRARQAAQKYQRTKVTLVYSYSMHSVSVTLVTYLDFISSLQVLLSSAIH